MKNISLYNKTVDILVQAYFNDTLSHGYACGCAVGNLVAANMGIQYKRLFDKPTWATGSPYWAHVHSIGMWNEQNICPANYTGKAKQEIDSTGYSYTETAMIERAFEMADAGANEDEYMFNTRKQRPRYY